MKAVSGFSSGIRVCVLLMGLSSPSWAVCRPSEPVEPGGKAPPVKPAWAWTDEERVAERFDPTKRQARNQQDLAVGVIRALPAAGVDSLSGATHPELFLPMEVFDHMVFGCLLSPRGDLCEIQMERAAALGLGADLWERLEKAMASYLAELRRQDEEARRQLRESKGKEPQATPEQMFEEGRQHCAERLQAMTAAEQELGKELYLRLLYEAVVPDSNSTSLIDETTAARLLWISKGCP